MAKAILKETGQGTHGKIKFLSSEDLSERGHEIDWNKYFFLINNLQIQGQTDRQRNSSPLGVRVVPAEIIENENPPRIQLVMVAVKDVDSDSNPIEDFREPGDMIALECGTNDEPHALLELEIINF